MMMRSDLRAPMSVMLLVLLSVLALAAMPLQPAAAPRRHLLIVVDGLRPDYVTADVMPNLTALGKRGAVFAHHHSVYPTVTRVNASSISTGAYPETHGLVGNTVFFPRVDAAKFLDTADYPTLQKIAETEGRLLTAPTLGETLQAAGRKMLVVSSGSSGSAFLNNHMVAGGAILHPQYVLPAALAEDMTAALGPAPTERGPGGTLDRYAVDAFLKVGLPKVDPSVTVMWLGELDSTAHDKGIGAPETIATLRRVDGEIKRIEDGLKSAGLFDNYDIWVTSDHGFSTHTGGIDLAALLKPFARALSDGSPRIVTSGGAIYVRDGDESAVTGIVALLQQTKGVGAIFTRAAQPGAQASTQAGALDGHVPGTLSFDAIRGQHDRTGQILFSPEWTDAVNAYGMKGTAAAGGTAGHGSSSPWDVHNTLIAAGPDVKPGLTIEAASANVDFAPTFLKLLGLPIPPSMQGRVLLDDAHTKQTQHTARTRDGGYAVTATFSIVTSGGREYRYFDSAAAARK